MLPAKMSVSDEVWLYEYDPSWIDVPLPASAYTAAIIGVETLVPPKTSQPGSPPNVVYTATPVFGSPTADTSLLMRIVHTPGLLTTIGTLLCQDGWAMYRLHSAPESSHAVSVCVALPAFERVVPPTAVTSVDAVG